MRIRLCILFVILSLSAVAQQLPTATVYGKVTDEQNHPIEMANVIVTDLLVGQTTNVRGSYELNLIADTTLVINFSFIGYEPKQVAVRLKSGERRKLDVTLRSTMTNLPDAVISDRAIEVHSLTKLDPKQATLLPSMGAWRT